MSELVHRVTYLPNEAQGVIVCRPPRALNTTVSASWDDVTCPRCLAARPERVLDGEEIRKLAEPMMERLQAAQARGALNEIGTTWLRDRPEEPELHDDSVLAALMRRLLNEASYTHLGESWDDEAEEDRPRLTVDGGIWLDENEAAVVARVGMAQLREAGDAVAVQLLPGSVEISPEAQAKYGPLLDKLNE